MKPDPTETALALIDRATAAGVRLLIDRRLRLMVTPAEHVDPNLLCELGSHIPDLVLAVRAGNETQDAIRKSMRISKIGAAP